MWLKSIWPFLRSALWPGRALIPTLLIGGGGAALAGLIGTSLLVAVLVFLLSASLLLVVAEGVRLRHQLDTGAVLAFHERPPKHRTLHVNGGYTSGEVGSVAVTNEPPHPTPDKTAAHVVGRLHFFRADGTPLFETLGNWPEIDTDAIEIPPSGVPHLLDVAFKDVMDTESYGIGRVELEERGDLAAAHPMRHDRKLLDPLHYCRIELRGVGVGARATQWVIVENADRKGLGGIDLVVRIADPPGWAE